MQVYSNSRDQGLSRQELLEENHRLRKKLSSAEARYLFGRNFQQDLLGSINIGFWERDETTKQLVYISKEVAEIVGTSQESLYERYQREGGFYDLIHPDDLDNYRNSLSANLKPESQGDPPRSSIYRLIRPDGEVRHILELKCNKLEERGAAIRTQGMMMDITGSQQSEQTYRESEQLIETLYSYLPVGIQIQNWSSIKSRVDKLQSEGVENIKEYFEDNPLVLKELVDSISITSVNKALLEIYRANSAEDYIEEEESPSDWWNESWADLYASEISALAGSEKIYDNEIHETRSDNSPFVVRFTTRVVEGDEDNWDRVLTVVEDVTERTNILKTIEDNETKLSLAVRTANVGYWHFDEVNDVYLDISEEYANIFGYTVEEFLENFRTYENDSNLIHPEDREKVESAYNSLYDQTLEYRVFHRDGSIVYVREIVKYLRDKNGNYTEAIGTLQDITDLKLAELENTEMLEKLHRKQRLSAVGQMVATVSHELRNPLSAIRLSFQMLQKQTETSGDKKTLRVHKRINRNIDRCDQIINELLDFTRMSELSKHPLQIGEWLESVISEQNIPHGIEVEKHYSLKEVELPFDSNRLRRAVINVVDNACQAMLDHTGEIKKGSLLSISTRITGKRFEIAITDTGGGIPEKDLEKIFEPLYSTKSSGVGLGMSIIKQIMEQHDGDIEIESEENKGTTVTLWLPI